MEKQPEMRRMMWESDDDEEIVVEYDKILSSRTKKVEETVAVLHMEDEAEVDLIKNLDLEGIKGTNNLFSIDEESESDPGA